MKPRVSPSCLLYWVHCLGLQLGRVEQAATWLGLAGRAALALLVVLTAGCAGLPPVGERPVSAAILPAEEANTPLGRQAVQALAGFAPDEDGVHPLAEGPEALAWRLSLVAAARRSIDAQYYLVADDATGREFLDALRAAAGRGVRVRLLVDDLHTAALDGTLAALAARANIEVRLFNPLPAREGAVAARVLMSAHQFGRINRRMHNKLFVVDNAVAIAGGRNIADAYFDRGAPEHFIDLDLLLAGAAVDALSRTFDGYWNSPLAWPVQRFMPAPPPAAEPPEPPRPPLWDGATPMPWPPLLPARVRVMADPPEKRERAGDGEGEGEGVVAAAHLAVLDAALEELHVVSPYVVPTPAVLQALRGAARRARVSLVTNSIATTDEPMVHAGYARHRPQLLSMQLALFELRPVREAATAASGATGAAGASGLAGGSLSGGRLHAKLTVADRRVVFLGSMNLDRRSQRTNTELGLRIECPALAEALLHRLAREHLPRSYAVRAAPGAAAIEWVAGEGAAQRVYPSEPDAPWALRARLALLSALVDEDLL